MKVFGIKIGSAVKITPTGAAVGQIHIRWSVNKDQNPRVARVGIQADEAEFTFEEIEKAPAPVFAAGEYALYPEFVVTLNPGGERGPVWVRPVFNHHPERGASLISVEFPPDAYTVAPNFSRNIRGRGNGPFRNLARREPANAGE